MLACQERQILGYIDFGMTLWFFIWGFNRHRLNIVLKSTNNLNPNLVHAISVMLNSYQSNSKELRLARNCAEAFAPPADIQYLGVQV